MIGNILADWIFVYFRVSNKKETIWGFKELMLNIHKHN